MSAKVAHEELSPITVKMIHRSEPTGEEIAQSAQVKRATLDAPIDIRLISDATPDLATSVSAEVTKR